MSWQRIELNMIPDTKVLPVVHASQFDSNRSISFQMFIGEDEWTIPEGLTIELHCRKVDDNIVTLSPLSVEGSVITFITTEQLTACSGQNKCELSFIDADDLVIGSLNFILDVEPDPLKGGLTSASSIYDLTQQIEDIATEVIGENYYDKTEVDTLLADKADAATTYTKSETDSLLSAKANTADLATVATTGDYDDLLNKPVLPDMTQYYTKSEVDSLIDNIYPTLTASGEIATFSTALTKPLVSVTADTLATTITLTSKNLFTTMVTTTNDGITTSYDNSTGYISITNDSRTTNYSSGSMRGDVVNNLNSAHTYRYEIVPNVTGVVICDENSTILNNEFTGITSAKLKITNTYDFVNVHPIGDTTMIKLLIVDITEGSYITKPIAEATTIQTLTGVNNVFTDTGSVTVQYKYMSI